MPWFLNVEYSLRVKHELLAEEFKFMRHSRMKLKMDSCTGAAAAVMKALLLERVTGERDVWVSLLNMLPLQPNHK